MLLSYINNVSVPKSSEDLSELYYKNHLLVDDVSNMVFKYAFLTQKPSILCLFGFNGITYPTNDKYYSMLESVTHNVYSLEELKKAFLEYSVIQKAKITKMQEFFRGAVI